MTDIVKLVNDVSSLYQEGLLKEDGGYVCPVCKKKYKQLGSAHKHLDRQDCYTVKDLFSGTEYENNAYVFFQSVMSGVNPSARITKQIFVKSKSYSSFVRFILFTSYHDVVDKGLYYSWLHEIVGLKHVNKILSEALKETRLREFRKFLQKNSELIDSESFVDKYRDDLIEDQHFFIRSIEKSHVSVAYLSSCAEFPFDEVCGSLYDDYYLRLMEIVDAL